MKEAARMLKLFSSIAPRRIVRGDRLMRVYKRRRRFATERAVREHRLGASPGHLGQHQGPGLSGS